MVAKQQILATSGLRGGQNKRNLPRGVAHPMQMNRQAPEQDLLSPGFLELTFLILILFFVDEYLNAFNGIKTGK
jgi:hypothetical protein